MTQDNRSFELPSLFSTPEDKRFGGFTFGFIFLLWLAWNFLPLWLGLSAAEKGVWGDSFGGLNTLFSGLALAGVAYAVVLQQRELQATRESLELAKSEAARNEGARADAEKQAARQARNAYWSSRLNALRHMIDAYGIKMEQFRLRAERSQLPAMFRHVDDEGSSLQRRFDSYRMQLESIHGVILFEDDFQASQDPDALRSAVNRSADRLRLEFSGLLPRTRLRGIDVVAVLESGLIEAEAFRALVGTMRHFRVAWLDSYINTLKGLKSAAFCVDGGGTSATSFIESCINSCALYAD